MSSKQQELIPVEVAYALPDRQEIISLSVERGCTALEAARRSNIAEHFPEIDLDKAAMGIFAKALDGKLLPTADAYQLEPMDRVEIYRPLLIDPKQARQARAAKAARDKPGKKAGQDKSEAAQAGRNKAAEKKASKAAGEGAEAGEAGETGEAATGQAGTGKAGTGKAEEAVKTKRTEDSSGGRPRDDDGQPAPESSRGD